MKEPGDTERARGLRRGNLAAVLLLASVALGLVSCDRKQVTQPIDDGTLWTRLTSTAYSGCLHPDLLGDSLVYTVWAVNPGDTLIPPPIWDRLAFSADDGADPFIQVWPGVARWDDSQPRWAGRQIIVFQSSRADTTGLHEQELYYRDVETFVDRRLFKSPTLNETAPAPRPNSPSLAYVEFASPPTPASMDRAGRIVLIPDTASVPLERIYLTPDSMQCGEPSWDPTGQRLVFSVLNPVDFTRHLYTMNLVPGDSLPVQITVGAVHDFSPRWSPDGNRILFASDRTGRSGLWVVHPGGEGQGLQLVSFEDSNAGVTTPVWTEDGMGIIASSDGRGHVRSLWLLTNLPVFDF